MSTAASSEACLFQGRVGEWVRECFESNISKFNERGVLRKNCAQQKQDTTKAMMYCTLRTIVQSVKMTALLNMTSQIQK